MKNLIEININTVTVITQTMNDAVGSVATSGSSKPKGTIVNIAWKMVVKFIKYLLICFVVPVASMMDLIITNPPC